MVGKVENIQELIISSKDEVGKSRFKFEISDGSNKVKVTLFDLFGQHVEKELYKGDKENSFIIISCARVGRYEGVPHLSNYPATRVFINPDHYSITELKLRWGNKKKPEMPSSVVTSTKIATAVESIKLLTVKEIKALNADFNKPSAYCQVIAKRFSDQKNWYFNKCTGCDLELENVGAKFVCTQKNGCGRTIPYPDKRFRLCIFCSDDTGSMAIVFPDDEISRIIDKTVIDLQTDCADEKDVDKFPEILNTLLKQKYTINLVITKDNLTKGSTIYEAKDVVLQVETVGNHDPNAIRTVDKNVAEMEEISVDAEHEARATETPDTGKSTNMKSRARKEMEPVRFNAENLSGEKKFKNIKLEKP
uniref:Replication factor A C-terminal domain-containing protein n=1 Tax=Daucus carota subsp. sativus TaxID=79200 RepID=A0A162AJK2_DAUCS